MPRKAAKVRSQQSTFSQTSDHSIEHADGRLIALSLSRFRDDVVTGNNCFLCCKKSIGKQTHEHVIPDWILRRCGIDNNEIFLLNGYRRRYSQYKINCCYECNQILGRKLEEPISNLFTLKYEEFVKALDRNRGRLRQLLFQWLNLLVIKTHLMDRNFRFSQDLRVDSGSIADRYPWEALHHIHCVARSQFTKAVVDQRAIGSMFILQTLESTELGDFDYTDVPLFPSVMIRMKGVAVIAMLNDRGACESGSEPLLKRINAPLSPIQLRELFAKLVCLNNSIVDRGVFYSSILRRRYRISATGPKFFAFSAEIASDFGQIMHDICGPLIKNSTSAKDKLDLIRSGKATFLFNERGEFAAERSPTHKS